MDKSKKEYLSSLLTWAEELEAKVSQVNTKKTEVNAWINELNDWKQLIHTKLNSDEEVSEESIYDLQDKSKNLVHFLQEIIGQKPRREPDAIKPGNHKLPPLPYDYNALEPHISERIMKLHHDEHHQSYVDGLNKAEKEIYLNKHDSKLMKHWMREQAFHGSGHYLHTIFWDNMSPKGGGTPNNSLLGQIKKDFGSFKQFKTLFTKAAESVEGVGWSILVWQPRAGRLGIQTVEKHQMYSLWDSIPLLVLDVWEHAYYLQYENNRGNYIENWWNVVNWDHVEKRYETAITVVWPLF